MSVAAILSALRNPWILLLIACVAGAGGTGWYRMRWESEVAARAADQLAAERAKADALQWAQKVSDKIVTEQAQALAANANKVAPVIERIIHAPVTSTCGPTVRDAVRGVRDLLSDGPAGGGSPVAGRGAPLAVR